MKLFLVVFIFLTGNLVLAQESESTAAPVAEAPKPAKPLGRIRGNPSPPNDSSSFIGDADNIDPLNPNRDNLKDDAEPVLEDIKSVLDAPKKKKKTEIPAAATDSSTTSSEPAPPPPEVAVPAPITIDTPLPEELKPEEPKLVEPAPEEVKPSLAADDPDLILEKKFNQIFRRYNINPTPDDIWAAASSKQTARVYEVQKGDTLWSISKILFGDANFWPKLWALNKQGILNPHFINPKMKIYFYEGDEENAPTLTVGDKAKTEEPQEPVNDAPADTPAPPPQADVAAAAAGPADQSPNGATAPEPPARTRSKNIKVSPLPPSLPISRNENYYAPKQKLEQKLVIDLGVQPEVVINPNNDLIVSDEKVKTEVEIEISEVAKFRCNDGRLLKEIKFTGALAPEYDIYERLNDLNTTTGIKYVYRLHGRAVPYQSKYLKAVECRSLIATDLIIVPKDKMKEMNTRKVSETPEARLIGGPDVREQRLFEKLHYGFVDFGAAEFTPGQEYRTISQLTDKVNSEFKIVEKYGSYAVVFFTEVADVIEVGDKVVNK